MSGSIRLAVAGVVSTLGLLFGGSSANAAVEGSYNFNENGGTVATDASGNSRNGTLTNFADTTPSIGDSSASGWMASGKLKFDGSNDHVQTPVLSSLLSSPAGFTTEVVFAYDATAGGSGRTWTPLVGSSLGNTSQIFFIGKKNATNNLHINFSVGLTTASYDPTTAGVNVFDGSQHHVAVVYDPSGAQDVIRTYVDGLLKHTQNVGGTYSGASALWIGATGHSTGERWIGSMDAVRFSSEALGPAQFIPEPASLSLVGVVGMALLARRRQR